MKINIIYQKDNATIFTYENPSPNQLSILPIERQIIEYDNTRYMVKQVVKKYKTDSRFGRNHIEIESIDIMVSDDNTGRCW